MITTLRFMFAFKELSYLYKSGIGTLLIGLLSLTSTQAQTISGTVFRDFNSNGTYQSIPASGTYAYGEPGEPGIVVIASITANSFTTTTIAFTQAISFAL